MATKNPSGNNGFPDIYLRIIPEELRQIQGIVFDIDGVLLDVSKSFREAISYTTQYYFTDILGWDKGPGLITLEETQLFKMAGGFNNDWDLTDIVILFYLAKAAGHPEIEDLGTLRSAAPSLQKYVDSVQREGGGMQAGEEIALRSLSSETVAKVKDSWNRTKIRRIFQEYYAGTHHCRRLYGFEPENIAEIGFLEQERVLVDTGLLEPWRGKIGILTGRAEEEALLAAEMTGLDDFVSHELIMYDDGSLRKPNPEALISLAEKMSINTGIYFGDTADDLRTVNNLKALRADVKFYSGVILHNEAERSYFMEHEVDLLASDVNEALRFLAHARSGDNDD